MRDLSMIYPGDYYREKFGGKLEVRDTGKYKTFSTLEEWNKYPYKNEILKQVQDLRRFMKKKSSRWWNFDGKAIGMYPNDAKTAIYEGRNDNIYSITKQICQFVDEGNNPRKWAKIHESLVKTELGQRIKKDLLDIKSFSKDIFCHTKLSYDSLIVDNNKLVGVTNWEYAGYYPPEFDDVIYKYVNEL